MAKILAIDDKQDNLIILSAVLKNFLPGCTVITAQSGAEGIEKAAGELPDTIILDIKMPGMDGFEVCRRLKSDGKTRCIPIIMLTAVRIDAKSRIKGLDLGADAFLGKPVDETELAAQVNVMLRIKKAEDILRKERDLLEETVQERTKQLSESEARYRSLMENIDLGITWIDSDYNIVMTNAAHGKLLNKPSGEFIDKKCFREFEKRDSVCPHCPGVGAMAAGHRKEVETEGINDDGSRIKVRIQAFPILGHDGVVTGFIEVVEDITERKQMEEENRKLEDQLRQAQKMEALGTLAGGIAHDFNNMLNAIFGYSDLLLDDLPKEGENYNFAAEIKKAGIRAADLIRQILLFSRRTQHKKHPLQIQHILKEALKLLKGSLPATIEIRQEINPACRSVLADATQIHQIVMNLCANAYHAMREHGGVLEVKLEERRLDEKTASRIPNLSSGKYILLSVSDSGHGMDSVTMQRIFEPYFTTKEKGEGTGLGLSTVHGIVKSHRGAISVESTPGKSTTFFIYLPVFEEAAVDSTEKEEKELPALSGRVLFVDDDQSNVKLGKLIIKRLGCDVVGLTNSRAALDVFRAAPDRFDIVITDQTMPYLTGDKLAGEMLLIRPDIPIIMITGHSDIMDEKKAKSIGIKEFLMKPLKMESMARAINRALSSQMVG